MSKSCEYCLRPVHANGMCNLHYQRQQRGANLDQEVQWLEQLLTLHCGLKKCDKPVFLQGLCFEHFHQAMEHGLPGHLSDQELPNRCQLKRCRRRAQDNGFCQDHAGQLRQLQADQDLFSEAIRDKAGAFERKTLTLDQIDFDDTTYRMRQVIESSFVENLARSIRQVGLLHAPILEELPSGQYRIISGFCRCTALQLLARSQPRYREFEARVIEPDCFSHLELLKIAFEENDKRNYVNYLEKALKATQLKHRQALSHSEIAEVMGIGKRRVSELFKLVHRGHDSVLKALRDGAIKFYHAQELLKLDKAEQPRWLQQVTDNDWTVEQLRDALADRQSERQEEHIQTLLDNGIEGIEFTGSSKKRGPYPVKLKLEDRNMLRQFYREFVRKYYV